MLEADITMCDAAEDAGFAAGASPGLPLEWARAWALGLIEHLAIGVVLLDGAQRARYVNRAAAALLRRRGPISVDPAGVLRLRPARLARQFAKLTALPAGAPGEGQILALGRLDGEQAPTIAIAQSDLAGMTTLLLLDRRAVLAADALARLYALTRAEAAVLHQLVLGRSAREIAARHGVRVSTVRSQLKTLLGKTGTRRQAALVGKVLADSGALLILPIGRQMVRTGRPVLPNPPLTGITSRPGAPPPPRARKW